MKIIAVDLGGTKIAYGIVENGIIKKVVKTLTEAEKGPKFVINKIIENIETLMEKDVVGIGVGCPGPLNYKTGVVSTYHKLLGWKNIPLKRILEKHFKIAVKVDNDANVFTLGEKRASNVIGIILGTGIGSGAILDNKLYHGNEFATEMGAMIIVADGRKGSWIDGSFENYCSGPSIENAYFKKTGNKKTMIEIAKMQNKASKEVLDEAAHYLAIALNNIKMIFDPELIVIGGSVSKIKYYINKAVKEMNKMVEPSKIKVETMNNENSAMIGAYSLFTD